MFEILTILLCPSPTRQCSKYDSFRSDAESYKVCNQLWTPDIHYEILVDSYVCYSYNPGIST